jgi:Mg2+ and Co2+ transporter CorA
MCSQPTKRRGLCSVDKQVPRIEVIRYNAGKVDRPIERNTHPIDNLPRLEKGIKNLEMACRHWPVTWLNVDGTEDDASLHKILNIFHINPLIVEKIKKPSKYPQKGVYGGKGYTQCLFLTCRMFSDRNKFPAHKGEKLSIVYVKEYSLILTFQGNPQDGEHRNDGDCLENLRRELNENKDNVRSKPAEQLLFLILKNVITYYFLVLDKDTTESRLKATIAYVKTLRAEVAAHILDCTQATPTSPFSTPQPEDLAAQRAFLNTFDRKSAPIEADLCALEANAKITQYDKYIQIKALLANQLKPLEDALLKTIDAEILRAARSPTDDTYETEDVEHISTASTPIHRTIRIKNAIHKHRLTSMSEKIEELEYKILYKDFDNTSSKEIIEEINRSQNILSNYQKNLKPLLETLNYLKNEDNAEGLLEQRTRKSFKDLKDTIEVILESLKNYQDITNNLMNLHVSIESYKMNRVMKIFAFISVLFTPVTVIGSIYGMNFDGEISMFNMPELKWRYGYVLAWSVMGLMSSVILFTLWRSGWVNDILPSKKSLKRFLKRRG